jgi:hypothetical protein
MAQDCEWIGSRCAPCGTKLFVLRPNRVLETYDLKSGNRIGAQQLLATGKVSVKLEDADDVFVVYVSGRQIYARRTLDRKDVVLALPRNVRMPLHAQIEPAGLYYSYNVAGKDTLGRVGFVARARLISAFGTHG